MTTFTISDIPYSRKIWRELNLAVWRSSLATAKLKSANISYLHIYVWRSLTEPPNLNPPIFLQWRFRAQPTNLIPANISGYTVLHWLPKPNSYCLQHLRFLTQLHTYMHFSPVLYTVIICNIIMYLRYFSTFIMSASLMQ